MQGLVLQLTRAGFLLLLWLFIWSVLRILRTDIYALGALLYALLTGDPPVVGESTTAVLCKTIAGDIELPRLHAPGRNIPQALEAMACKALATRPEDRYPTADALLADLHAFTNGYATSAEAAGPLRLLWLVARRHRTLVLVILASLLALAKNELVQSGESGKIEKSIT